MVGVTEHFVPEARVLALAGHPETFARVHVTDPGAPTVLLSHGWLASADLNWYALYGALAERANFVAIDHRGHGRGAHSVEPFTLVDAADDAAALLDHLGVGPVVVAGYSMGGPIGLHLASRRPDLVSGLVLVSTALRFSGGFRDRLLWWARGATGLALRWRAQGRLFRRIVDRVSAED
ncbi:MAG: alpha/beta hydrolase, partial [Acidimicrobiia bacterium]|nr:alpha/beta hydrolase [Acidimicrobiia bacterium]